MKSPTLPVCIAIFVLAGCSHTIPETATKPQAPPQLGKTPPVIQPLSAGQKQAQAPESLLPVTMTADLTPVQKTIQSAVPERFTEEHHPRRRTPSADPRRISEVHCHLPRGD